MPSGIGAFFIGKFGRKFYQIIFDRVLSIEYLDKLKINKVLFTVN